MADKYDVYDSSGNRIGEVRRDYEAELQDRFIDGATTVAGTLIGWLFWIILFGVFLLAWRLIQVTFHYPKVVLPGAAVVGILLVLQGGDGLHLSSLWMTVPSEAELSAQISQDVLGLSHLASKYPHNYPSFPRPDQQTSLNVEATWIRTPREHVRQELGNLWHPPEGWAWIRVTDQNGTLVTQGLLGFEVVNGTFDYFLFIPEEVVRSRHPKSSVISSQAFSDKELVLMDSLTGR